VETELVEGAVGEGEGDEGLLLRDVDEEVDGVGEPGVDLPVEPRSQEVVLVFPAEVVGAGRVEVPPRLLGAGL